MIRINDNAFDTIRAFGTNACGQYVEVEDAIVRGTRHYVLWIDGRKIASGMDVGALVDMARCI